MKAKRERKSRITALGADRRKARTKHQSRALKLPHVLRPNLLTLLQLAHSIGGIEKTYRRRSRVISEVERNHENVAPPH